MAQVMKRIILSSIFAAGLACPLVAASGAHQTNTVKVAESPAAAAVAGNGSVPVKLDVVAPVAPGLGLDAVFTPNIAPTPLLVETPRAASGIFPVSEELGPARLDAQVARAHVPESGTETPPRSAAQPAAMADLRNLEGGVNDPATSEASPMALEEKWDGASRTKRAEAVAARQGGFWSALGSTLRKRDGLLSVSKKIAVVCAPALFAPIAAVGVHSIAGSTLFTSFLLNAAVFVASLVTVIYSILHFLLLLNERRFRFSLRDLFKFVALLAVLSSSLMGSLRSGGKVRTGIHEYKIESRLKDIHTQAIGIDASRDNPNRFLTFLYDLQFLHTEIQGAAEPALLRADAMGNRVSPEYHNYLDYYYPAVERIRDYARNHPLPWADEDIERLYKKYSASYGEEDIGSSLPYPDFKFVAQLYQFYRSAKERPGLYDDPEKLYLAYLDFMADKRAANKGMDSNQLKEKAQAEFSEFKTLSISRAIEEKRYFVQAMINLAGLSMIFMLLVSGIEARKGE